eukprot:Skav200075  [mRNA]  locus=scaffold838:492659:502286:+ [translate_table: standard]
MDTQSGIRIDASGATILTHQQPTLADQRNVIELCAGAGFLGEGLSTAGFSVKVVNDLRQKNCDMHENWRTGEDPKVICGDIAEVSTIQAIHNAHGGSSLVAFGFNCQPWSALGDQGRMGDLRATSLVSSLRAAYWLRAHGVLMECVTQAGPGRVFLEALHELGWRWEHAGTLTDHEGLTLNLFHSPIQAIRGRMRHAWQTRITCQMSTRKGFEFMQHVSVDATLASLHRVADQHDGLARTAIDGTFFTNDKLFHMGKVPDQKCTHCEDQDSLYHRYWECPHFQTARLPVPESSLREICNSHAVTAERGWLPDIPARLPFLHALNTIPDTTDDFLQCPAQDALPQHLFTDGSGLWPNHRDRRLVSWGVVKADLGEQTFSVLAIGGVPGILQTVLRAECVAAIAALKYVLVSKRDTTIWVDNQTVASRLQQALRSVQRGWANKYKDHDLWTQLLTCVHCIKQLGIRVQCIKVRAHQDIAEYPDTVEQWVILGNRAADTAAETALGMLPSSVIAAHRQVVEQSKHQEQLGGYLHGVLHAAGSIAVQSKRDSADSQEQRWQRAAHERDHCEDRSAVSFGGDRPLVQAPSTHSMRKCQAIVADWVRSLRFAGETTLQWVSYYHLFLHYLVTTGKPGFYFDRRTRVWETAEELVEEKGFYFLDRCNAFSHCVRCFALVSQLDYHPESRLPAGTLFRCWARCLLLPVATDFVFRLDRIFQTHGVHTIKRAKKDLVAFPQVKGDFFP